MHTIVLLRAEEQIQARGTKTSRSSRRCTLLSLPLPLSPCHASFQDLPGPLPFQLLHNENTAVPQLSPCPAGRASESRSVTPHRERLGGLEKPGWNSLAECGLERQRRLSRGRSHWAPCTQDLMAQDGEAAPAKPSGFALSCRSSQVQSSHPHPGALGGYSPPQRPPLETPLLTSAGSSCTRPTVDGLTGPQPAA